MNILDLVKASTHMNLHTMFIVKDGQFFEMVGNVHQLPKYAIRCKISNYRVTEFDARSYCAKKVVVILEDY